MTWTPQKFARLASTICLYAIGLAAVFILVAMLLGVSGYLIRADKLEFLIHPLSVLVGLLFLYKIAQNVLALITLQHVETMAKLQQLENLIQKENLQQLQALSEKMKGK